MGALQSVIWSETSKTEPPTSLFASQITTNTGNPLALIEAPTRTSNRFETEAIEKVSQEIKKFYAAFGGEYPPKPSFDNWPSTLHIYKTTCLEAPEKLHMLNNPGLFRDWMKEALFKVRIIVFNTKIYNL